MSVCIGLLFTLAAEAFGLPANLPEYTVTVPRYVAEAAVATNGSNTDPRECDDLSVIVVIVNDKVVFKMVAEPAEAGPW